MELSAWTGQCALLIFNDDLMNSIYCEQFSTASLIKINNIKRKDIDKA